jgi:hypothetical protein
MKKSLFLLLIVVFVVLLAGCNGKEEDNDIKDDTISFIPTSSVTKFNEEHIQALAIDFKGTDLEIANQIYDWQTENMEYKAFGEVADAMRWNYFLPGIYPTEEMIKDFSVLDNVKIEGLCYQFATIYCSIAEYYDLECRVTAMDEKPSDLDPKIDKRTTTGLAESEYNRLLKLLEKRDLYYSYETIRNVAKETSAHYRAEVKIDDNWKVMDASVHFVGGEYNKLYTFNEVDWLEGYNESLLGKSEKNTKEVFIDDLGNKNRASTIDEVREESLLVPYFKTWPKVAAFLKLPEDVAEELEEDFNLYIQFDNAYYAQTGKRFYIVCDFIIDDDSTLQEYAQEYKKLTGEDLDTNSYSALEQLLD